MEYYDYNSNRDNNNHNNNRNNNYNNNCNNFRDENFVNLIEDEEINNDFDISNNNDNFNFDDFVDIGDTLNIMDNITIDDYVDIGGNMDIDGNIDTINYNRANNGEIDSSKIFKDVKHILTSALRTKLLICLHSSKKDLKSLRKELDKPSTSILHGIRELRKLKLVKKENNYYELSSNGMILAVNILKLIENTYSINSNYDFWRYHTIEDIPQKFLKKIHYIHNSRYIYSEEGFFAKSNEYNDLISKSKKIKILTPIFFDIQLDMIINNLNVNGSLEIITTEEILDFMKINGHGYKLISLKQDFDIRIWKYPRDFKLFLTSCDNFLSLGLFSDEHYDDSSMLLDESEYGIKWGLSLFEYYKKDSELINIEKYFDIYEGHE